jgi:hypothetical protein
MIGHRLGLLLVLAALLAGCQSAAPATQTRAAPASNAPGQPAGVAAAPAPSGSSQEAAAPVVLRVAHAGVTPGVAAVWLATDLGLDKQYGLEIDLRQTRTAALSQAALLSGEIDYVWTGLAPTLGARSGGSEVIFMAATGTRAAGELVTQPAVNTPAALRGASLGVHSFGGPPHVRTLAVLKRLGMDVERDQITILATGDEPTTTAALLERAITGATLSYASAQEPKAMGYHSWDLGTLGVPDLLGIAGLPHVAHGRTEDTLRLLRAVAAGQAYLKAGATDPAAREQAGAVVAQRMRTNQIEPILQHLDRTREYLPLDLRIDMNDARELQAGMGSVEASVLQVSLESAIDQSFLDRLDAEGFFARLAAP